jgi:RNA polymerase sigma factor (sigma-70 family)
MRIDDHFFRHESGRIFAALTRLFGVHNLAMAEDVVQDAFCRALDVWKMRGIPENPSAWLMMTAKNRALDLLRRERTVRTFAPELGRLLESEWTVAPVVDEMFAANAIKDDLLRMMFSCCNPRLPEEAQIALILNILCGFTVDEIAGAFVSTHAAIEKRITRAKKVLASSKRLFDVTAASEFSERLPSVHRALYLLFNEGYHGASAETAVRQELCRESMRLIAVLIEHPDGATPATFALAALTSLHAARLPGRIDAFGNLHSLIDQNRSVWDQTLIAEGLKFLELSASGSDMSEYHIEAAIASHHACAKLWQDTDWQAIVSLYDTLVSVRPSPIVALNRAIAIAQIAGPEQGIAEMLAISDQERLTSYPFYFATMAELALRQGSLETAREQFRKALALARNPMERRFLEGRIASCRNYPSEGDGEHVC